MQAFFDTYSKYILPEDILILAVSGGVDSMVLLDLVLANHPRENIIVAHFDHSLRGIESDEDRLFIADFCKKRDIIIDIEKMNITILAEEEKMSIEMVARKYRYSFLRKVAEKYRAKYILTAHHLDDRIETAMFNLIRGTKFGGIHALSLTSARHCEVGSNPGKQDMDCHVDSSNLLVMTPTILRPLLHVAKSEILAYAKKHNITFREDSTNTDTIYLRNHLRHNILPEFERINPEYRRSIENFIEYTEELKNWIDQEVGFFLGGTVGFAVSDFEKKSPFFQKEILRCLYEKMNNGTIGLSEGNIEEMLRFVLTANGGTEKILHKLSLMKVKGIIVYSILL